MKVGNKDKQQLRILFLMFQGLSTYYKDNWPTDMKAQYHIYIYIYGPVFEPLKPFCKTEMS